MRRRIGELWIGLGVLHLLLIMVMGWSEFRDLLGDGYVNAGETDAERQAFFWLLYLGVPFIIVGVVTRWAQRRLGTVPESMGWVSLVCFLLGALAVPASGFWLGLVLAGYGIVVARTGGAGTPESLGSGGGIRSKAHG
ncbi:MAG: hypothetical protein GXX79_00870 [Actinomycetales bacterium]|nr:hypothetical protein [Actinomycetales bacterium]